MDDYPKFSEEGIDFIDNFCKQVDPMDCFDVPVSIKNEIRNYRQRQKDSEPKEEKQVEA